MVRPQLEGKGQILKAPQGSFLPAKAVVWKGKNTKMENEGPETSERVSMTQTLGTGKEIS